MTGDIQRADHLVKNTLKERLEQDVKMNTEGPADKKAAKDKNKKTVEPLSPELRRQYELILEQVSFALARTYGSTAVGNSSMVSDSLTTMMVKDFIN